MVKLELEHDSQCKHIQLTFDTKLLLEKEKYESALKLVNVGVEKERKISNQKYNSLEDNYSKKMAKERKDAESQRKDIMSEHDNEIKKLKGIPKQDLGSHLGTVDRPDCNLASSTKHGLPKV